MKREQMQAVVAKVIELLESAESDADTAGDEATKQGMNRYAAEAGLLLARIDNALTRLRSVVKK